MISFTLFANRQPLAGSTAFSNFFTETHLQVFRYALVLCSGREQEAEDITAETFLRAWKSREQFHGDPDQALHWVFTIARHNYIDHHRSEAAQPLVEVLGEEQECEAPGPEETLVACGQVETLLAALNQVTVAEREMIYLRYGLGWRVGQVALHLGLKDNTVSVSLRRALERVRTRLAAKEGTS